MFVGPSLYAALKRLRDRDRDRLLWIDQLCINQDDNKEKSVQVVLMTEIYENAQQTVVWLGEEDRDTEVLTEMVKELSVNPLRAVEDDTNLVRPMLDLALEDPKVSSRGQWRHQALVRLLNRSWFS